ncbi:oxygenase MpaB family protein [Polyangium mundeleinium]|uniref:Oxygenase MpaB family protein n=1 Tax=Polyangium mundeleinium TaxID=2995306 RepID=A0ABT5EXE3_9BACT|nr:oxygenase MpaB family protein [Polyangium mundeleinium]MDC0746473.1 oxygenase MpaB family protein [Polyangium mundeleinium]
MKLPIPLRTHRWDDEIARLDPERDYEAIIFALSNHVFPFEILLAMEIAQLRTFTIPTISKLLHATGQYEREGPKRLDDTKAILSEIHRPGLESRASREMVEHLNRIHGLYRISNDDFLYTLSTFVFDPILFIDKWGHRPMTEKEKDAFYFLYRRLGELMHIRDVPGSRAAFFAWRQDYERRAQRYASENEAVARGLLVAVQGLLPPMLVPILEPAVVFLTADTGFRNALGLREPDPGLARSLRVFFAVYRRAARHVSLYEHRKFEDSDIYRNYPTYPEGYDRLRLGPTKVLEILAKKGAERAVAGE